MQRSIAYLGDTSLPGPASYLAGIMTHFRLPFVYVPSSEPPPPVASKQKWLLWQIETQIGLKNLRSKRLHYKALLTITNNV